MIKNERQYRITRAHAGRLRKALRAKRNPGMEDSEEAVEAAALGVVRESGAKYSAVHPLIAKAREDAMNSQLSDLEGELKEYEALKAGGFDWDSLKALADIPKLLIQARISTGLSQRELAERLGVKEQQIQRYEATDYAQASLKRLLEVAAVYRMGEGENSAD